MAISSSEISDVIKQRLRDFDAEMVSADVGRVISVGDGIAQIFGLTGVMAGELIQFPGDTYGLALNLEEDQVRAVVMGPYEHIQEGEEVRTTGRIVEVPVGPELLGRTVNALGQPIDGQGPINAR
ncbi:MAG TPA: F0F1 ATP synthase subunit alpha, partial [Candidatus Dormibacteraeota bacterium]|nr:F0F1 ATP synthase subunit alpha [Candidatus Dormibacteraeota bacterium]